MCMDEIDKNVQSGKEFIRNRITDLRLKTDVSEYQMSLELGQNRGYIQSISSGKAMPSMAGFLNICDYFGITPLEFFDEAVDNPSALNRVYSVLKSLDEDDLELIEKIAHRMNNKN